MFNLKKSVKRVIGLALAGVVLASSVQGDVKASSKIFSLEGSTRAYLEKSWDDVKDDMNKSLLGLIGGKGSQYMVRTYPEFMNGAKQSQYSYVCVANSSRRALGADADEKKFEAVRRIYIKDLGMYTSKKNHFPEINDFEGWLINPVSNDDSMYAHVDWNIINILTCQSCKHSEEHEGYAFEDSYEFLEGRKKVDGKIVPDGTKVAIKKYMCPKCGKVGNWKVKTELELSRDGEKNHMPAVLAITQANKKKGQTAKMANITFYTHVTPNMRATLTDEIGRCNYDFCKWVSVGESASVVMKKGKKAYYFDANNSPATFKSSKSSVVKVSNKRTKGRYVITAKKKGTATVTATNMWGQKYKFKITVK